MQKIKWAWQLFGCYLLLTAFAALVATRLLAYVKGQWAIHLGLVLLVIALGWTAGSFLRRYTPLSDSWSVRLAWLGFLGLSVLPAVFMILSMHSYYATGIYILVLGLVCSLYSWVLPAFAERRLSPYLLLVLLVLILLPAWMEAESQFVRWLLPGWLGLLLLQGLALARGQGKMPVATLAHLVFVVSAYYLMGRQAWLPQQQDFEDRVVRAVEHPDFQLLMTRWRDGMYVYLDKQKQISTFDDYLYYEVMVHPAMALRRQHAPLQQVLLLGGETGGSLRELMKYDGVHVTQIPYLPAYLETMQRLPELQQWHGAPWLSPGVSVRPTSLHDWLAHHEQERLRFDVIVIDLPDPEKQEYVGWYSLEFYALLKRHLAPGGVLVTQAGSPYFASRAFNCIVQTIDSAGYATLPVHNQVLTLGEWGWVLASPTLARDAMQQQLDAARPEVATKWLNQEAMQMLSRFGKDVKRYEEVEVNTLEQPVLLEYYLQGNWRF